MGWGSIGLYDILSLAAKKLNLSYHNGDVYVRIYIYIYCQTMGLLKLWQSNFGSLSAMPSLAHRCYAAHVLAPPVCGQVTLRKTNMEPEKGAINSNLVVSPSLVQWQLTQHAIELDALG